MPPPKVQDSLAARAAVVALLGWVLGSALQLQQPGLWPTPVYAGLVLTGLIGLVGMVWAGLWPGALRPWLALASAALLAALLGFSSVGLRAQAFDARRLAPALEGQDLRVVGTVAAMPQRSELGWRFRFDVDQAWQGSAPVAVPGRIDLGWYARGGFNAALVAPPEAQTLPALRAGERWQFTVRLKAPHGQVNPHGFDVELWWWEQGIQATGTVRDGPKDLGPQRLGDSLRHPLESARQTVRDAIFLAVADRRLAGVVAALVTGDQNAIERADWDIYRATGVAHLMSISGLHITLFAWTAAWGVGGLWRRSTRLCLAWPAPRAALLGGLLLAWAYALFSGWGVPAQRTVLMLATAGLLRLAGARWPWPVVALLAMAVVVMADPWALLQAGFWLSFVAVAVLFASDTGADRMAAATWRGRLAGLWREQWVVTLALTPLSVLLFSQVSLVGLLANLVAIPWVTGVVTPLALLGVLWAPLWQLAAGAVEGLGLGLQALASLPWASGSRPAPALWAGVLGVGGGLLLALRWPWPVRLLGLPLVLPVLLWQNPRPAPGEFELLAADVGQGNAVLVRTAHHSLLYDAGPRYAVDSDAGHRVLVPLLRALDERLDLLLLSHRDLDHTGGAPAVLAMQPQAALLSSIEAGHPLQALRPARRCLAGQRWDWDGVQLAVLHPQPGDEERGHKSNALSCVLRIDNGRRAALLVGDIEAPQEAQLVAAGVPLQADLLLVPHHGSKTSSTAGFVAAVRPRWALVQAGYRNRFGHPAPEVVDRYRAHGATLLDSAHCGALAWSSQGQAAPRCERQAAPRYWRHHPPE